MSKVRSIIALIVTAPALFGTFYGLGPELMRDIRLRNEPFTPAINAKIEEAKCTNVWFVLAHCTVKYVLNQSPRSTATDLNFAFFGRAGGTVRLLHAASDSAIVATDVELAHVTNRIVCFVFLVGGFGLIGYLALQRLTDA